eukprot:CAMPEP_0172945010 /NCGR_PEP_ID=MMETSP1075-20121228/226332_1 /TAXON_ID=2916 /ORGANISM="Ceratium fusus, Strain PA161109" /LENGTH=348 /DNA_ID=CAMNT_0013806441 /DNA_START=844 /DNA_END=1889 /DNA_ORIENTATION=+
MLMATAKRALHVKPSNSAPSEPSPNTPSARIDPNGPKNPPINPTDDAIWPAQLKSSGGTCFAKYAARTPRTVGGPFKIAQAIARTEAGGEVIRTADDRQAPNETPTYTWRSPRRSAHKPSGAGRRNKTYTWRSPRRSAHKPSGAGSSIATILAVVNTAAVDSRWVWQVALISDLEKQGRLQQRRCQVKSELRADDRPHAKSYPATWSVLCPGVVVAGVAQARAPTHLPDVDPALAASARLFTPIKAAITEPRAPTQLSKGKLHATFPAFLLTRTVAFVAKAACPVQLAKRDPNLAELTILLAFVIAQVAQASAPMLLLVFKARPAHLACHLARHITIIAQAVIVLRML